MPDGSSSDAPVISPGPSRASNPFLGGSFGVRTRAMRPAITYRSTEFRIEARVIFIWLSGFNANVWLR